MDSNNGQISNSAFQEALQRARQLAAKITQQAGGKRPAEEVVAPDPKRVAAVNDPIGAQLAAMKHQIITKPLKNQKYLNGIVINGEKTLDIMIPGNKVGYVIGKGGEMIRNLQERAGVKMTVFQDSSEATEEDKQLRIIGIPDKVDYARQLVNDLLTEKEIETVRLKTNANKSMTNEYGTSRMNNIEVPVPPQYIGLVIGKGGESIRRIQQETGCKVQFDTTKSDPQGNKICQIGGHPEAVSRAVDMVKEIVENATHGRISKPRDGEEVRMSIPAHRTGAVIGRGGETIRALKQQSGCDIELEKAFKGGNPDEKYFIIRGTPDKISYAQQLILERVNGSSSSGGYNESQPPAPPQQQQQQQQQWSNYWQSETSQSSDDSKSQDANYAAWAAYYAQYYAQAQQQPTSTPTPNASNGSSSVVNDSSAPQSSDQPHGANQEQLYNQWAEYYRAYGMFKEAEMIEQMAKGGAKASGDESKQTESSDKNASNAAAVAYPGYNYSNYKPHPSQQS